VALTAGTRLGPYEITAQIGVGGMGEVWCATDTNLGRQVAIKILPDAFAHDPERLARFEREAKTLASLNHPNIAQIYGLEKTDSIRALVMELVEGPTLADRIAQGPIPIDEALAIAKQIAEALEAAHEQGIIHRDLKPPNVKVRDDGMVKVLDFGLAKIIEGEARSSSSLSMSPTITTPAMTQAGLILGTAAYMSPEQAKGRLADKRSDVWAFGCVLFEMLAGRRIFQGDDVTDVLVAVLSKEPDWTALPAATPRAIHRVLRRSLERDRRRRLADIADARLEIEEALIAPAIEAVPAAAPRAAVWQRLMLLAGCAVVVASLAGWVAWTMKPAVSGPVARFSITLPAGDRFLPVESARHVVAASPDGSRIAYVANGRLYLRMRDQLPAVAITEGVSPFFSSDGQWLGFWQEGHLKKVSVHGGAPIVLCASAGPFGASWASDDTILYGQGPGGIWRVSAAGGTGGTPENLVKVNAGERAHGPQLLPGGRAVLFTLAQAGEGWDDAQIVVQSLDGGARQVVVRGGTDARYLPTGHLVYALRGSLLALPFDVGRLEVTGGPVPLVDEVAQSVGRVSGAAQFAVSGDGTLVYVPSLSVAATARFFWVDRMGHEEPVSAPPGLYLVPRLSPDGGRVAYQTVAGNDTDIWTYEFRRGIFQRLTSDPGRDSEPVWSPDGHRIAYHSAGHEGGPGIFVRAADGTGNVERLTTGTHLPSFWSPDGRIVFSDFGTSGITPTSPTDSRAVRVTGDHRVETLLATPAREGGGRVAPNGRWLAYESDETGENAIFVRPFPAVSTARWPLSSGGGESPVWARNSQTLFYRKGEAVMAVAVRGVTPADWGTPERLFEGPYFFIDGPTMFDVAPDERFLMLKQSGDDGRAPTPDRLIVVQHWFEELKRRVPTN
jgi:eukaryotic-like serine/threonine-protein kinase